MKNRYLTFIALLLLLCTQTLWSQEVDQHLDMNNMSFFKEATMVVEGRFLKPVFSYAVKDIQGKEHYYGICPVIAYKVFKGNAKAGDTLYVIREDESLLLAKNSPFDYYPYVKTKIYDPISGDSIEEEEYFWDEYYYPPVCNKYRIDALDHFRNDCVLFFKVSTYPKTEDKRYAHLSQYQYLYPWVFYDEGTKLYVSDGRFAGLNDTLFNSRNDLYRFMLEAGGYDTTVVKISEPKTQDKNRDYINRTLPPEVEQRWGGQKKNTPDQR